LPPSQLFAQTSLCNDIAVAADGTAYVTDSLSGHILRLKPGATALEIWAHDARWDVKGAQFDGIAGRSLTPRRPRRRPATTPGKALVLKALSAAYPCLERPAAFLCLAGCGRFCPR